MPRSCLTLTDCLTRRRPLLVVHFIPDASKAAREMRRVTKSGGVVATTMWEAAQANELNASLWEAAIPTDPKAKADVRGYRFQASAFRSLERPRFGGYRSCRLAMGCQFCSFDDYWSPLTKGQGPAGAYLKGISESPSRLTRATAPESNWQPCRRAIYTSGESVGSSWGRTLNDWVLYRLHYYGAIMQFHTQKSSRCCCLRLTSSVLLRATCCRNGLQWLLDIILVTGLRAVLLSRRWLNRASRP